MSKLGHDAPIFVKVKYVVGKQKDAAHVQYIGTRPGVARNEKQPERKAEENTNETDKMHLAYAALRPRSTGLFGPDPAKPPLLHEAQYNATERNNGVSWRLVISLKESDAVKMGFVGREKWEDLTRKNMDHFAKAIGVKATDLQWVAAHHPEDGHPHVHVLAYLKDGAPARRGALNNKELAVLRRGVVRECFGPMRHADTVQKTLSRDTLISTVKSNVTNARRLQEKTLLAMQIEDPISSQKSPKFTQKDLSILTEKLAKLGLEMPGKGRVALGFMPADVKHSAREIATWIMARPELADTMLKYRESNISIAKSYSNMQKKHDEVVKNAEDDLRDRVANIVLKEAAKVARNRVESTHQTPENATTKEGSERKIATRKSHAKTDIDVANTAVRSAFNVIDRERLKAEAQAELASIQAMEMAEEKAKKQELGRDLF